MKIKENQSGFSLAELIIVITIIFISFIGIASLMLQNLQVESLNTNQLLASMLAQEGVEMVRSVRDDNWLNTDYEWDRDLTDNADMTFTIDYRGRNSIDDTVDDIAEDGAKLYLDSNGYYSHVSSSLGTAFSRLITIEDYDDYLLVKSDVAWSSRFGVRHYIINATLYNWRGQ